MTDSTNSVRGRVEDIWKTHSDGQGVNAIMSLITEAETKARIDEAQYIQDNFVSPGSGYCDEIGFDDIRNRIAALKETHDE